MSDIVRIPGSTRGICLENYGRRTRIWWNEWSVTIWHERNKLSFHHLHDLTYSSAKKHKKHPDALPRCRSCNEEVPEDLYNHAKLLQLDGGDNV